MEATGADHGDAENAGGAQAHRRAAGGDAMNPRARHRTVALTCGLALLACQEPIDATPTDPQGADTPTFPTHPDASDDTGTPVPTPPDTAEDTGAPAPTPSDAAEDIGAGDSSGDAEPPVAVCGDGVCDQGEDPSTCPEDCPVDCGDQCPLSEAVHVATDGDDAQAGTLGAPWKTVQRALDYIATGGVLPDGGVTIWVHGGTYFVDAPIVIDASHSGTSESPVTIEAYPGEEPIFIGGRLVTGWTLDSDNVYKAQLPEVADGTWRFDQLFENGVRQTKARYPNSGYLRTDAPTNTQTLSFRFKAGELPTWSDYEGAQASIWATANWFENIVPISDIDFGTRTITVAKPLRQKNIAEDRYFIQGVKAALDTPGEFYLDEATGELFYWPVATPISDQQIVAPTVKNVFEFKGEGPTDRV
ncbi:MAG: hypothetical protein QF464_02365, partial [Myxococcota bacterium]|nr:hypothetical protein [Myxococcota bacterium]